MGYLVQLVLSLIWFLNRYWLFTLVVAPVAVLVLCLFELQPSRVLAFVVGLPLGLLGLVLGVWLQRSLDGPRSRY
jgi:hypothetical protein